MSIKISVIAYFVTFLVFLIVDMIWLGVVARSIYQNYLSDFLSDRVNWIAAFIFYMIFILGIFIFAIHPAILKKSLSHAILMGALFGFFTYATYDLTNLATLKNWPLPIVFIDILWGTALSAFVAYSGFYIVKFISSLVHA